MLIYSCTNDEKHLGNRKPSHVTTKSTLLLSVKMNGTPEDNDKSMKNVQYACDMPKGTSQAKAKFKHMVFV